MILYKCPKCNNTELDYDKSTFEDEGRDTTTPKDILLGSSARKIVQSTKHKEPTSAYCDKCDEEWDISQLKKEEVNAGSMIKLTFALMMISVMLFLSGLLLLVFSLLIGGIVIAGSILIFYITTILYKRF
jgi:hypothetical protein